MTIRYKFYGGMSDNDSRWKDATYIYSQNINTTNSEYIQVSPKARTMTELWANEIEYLVPTFANNLNTFWYVNDWKIYDKDKRVVYDHNYWQTKIDNSLKWVFYCWELYMMCYGANPLDWRRDRSDPYTMSMYYNWSNWTMSLWRQYSRNMWRLEVNWYGSFELIFNWKYNIMTWSIIRSYNEDLFTSSWISVQLWDWVRWVNIYWNWLKCYTTSWVLMLWDWVTGDWWIQDRYNLDLAVNNVKNINGIDYVFWERWLFYMNWTLAQPFRYKQNSHYLDFKKFVFPKVKIWYAKAWNFLYAPTKTNTWYDLNVLWQGSVWLPIQFSSVYSIPNCKRIIQMQAINRTWDFESGDPTWVIIFYEKNSWWYNIDYYSLEDYEQLNDTWYIITKEYEWESLIFTKYAKELKLYCDELKDNESLKIEASINWQDFFEVKTLTKNDSWKNGYYSILEFKREFHKIVFKLTLNWHFKLYDFVFYDNVKTT